MANEEHLKLLSKGREIWNEWRKANPDIQPDLSLANLEGVDLSWHDLKGAKLQDANLSGANLHLANLSKAYALRTNFRGCNFQHARCSGAFMHRSNLDGANLLSCLLYTSPSPRDS